MQEETKKPGIGSKIKEKIQQYRRTVEISVKPDKEEFVSSSKITALGIALVGIMGFVIYIIYTIITHL